MPAGGAIVSYDFWKLTPYVSGRLSLTKYESDNEKSKIAFLPAIGMDIRLTDETIITLEGGIIRDYYRKDDLYVTGFSVTF